MPVFTIIDAIITDPDAEAAMQEYFDRVAVLLEREGIRTVALDRAPTVIEGNWHPKTLIIHEHRDMASVRRFQELDDYRPLRELRRKFSNNNVVAVQGEEIERTAGSGK